MNAGRSMLVLGLLLLAGGLVYTVVYYLTQGFYDVSAPLADLGYANLAVAGGALCIGLVLAITGGVTMAGARRR
ncbi:cell division protein CrgA [Dactylosporangium sp. NPDC000244]|uniref:cell division protein CrgA n=1 Tax=Dactylosporangium sp. NPDC000244 TaxID=3154365 RepID=UPI0033297E37